MALFIILLVFLVYLFLKYATLAILFAVDFLIIGLASYSFLYEKFGHDSSLFIVGIILIIYAVLLIFISRKVRILNIIINYIASLFSAYLGIEIFLPMITGILKSMGILENTYSELVITHIESIDNIINIVFLIIISVIIYRIRINFIDEKFNLSYYIEKEFEDNYNTDEKYYRNDNNSFEYDDEDHEFYKNYYTKEYQNRNYNYRQEEQNNSTYIKDYYNILGINKHATQEEIRKAYYKLMAKYHPDKNKNSDNSNTITKLINEAYEVLSDEEKREQYDRFGTTL